MNNEIILVTSQDEAIGVMEKMEVHRRGLLHRAFSVFVFDRSGRMLLQQRAVNKYHGSMLWTNACCSHPFPGENIEAAAKRRLKEELGFITPVQKIFEFTYKAVVENNLIEYEFDHVFAGEYEGEIFPDEKEVNAVAYYSMDEIKTLLTAKPDNFTAWFKIAFPQVESWWQTKYMLPTAKEQ